MGYVRCMINKEVIFPLQGSQEPKPAIILLAAGSSSRLGQAKQLLKLGNLSFITYFVQEALTLSDRVIVVLGSREETIRKEIENLPINIVFNPEWEEGMATSIRIGIQTLTNLSNPNPTVILMVCDQPYVNREVLGNLYQTYRDTLKPIIASEYGNSLGTPVLFHESFYPELLKLKGNIGAKKIVSFHRDQSIGVPFPMGNMDIDTPDDLDKLARMDISNRIQ